VQKWQLTKGYGDIGQGSRDFFLKCAGLEQQVLFLVFQKAHKLFHNILLQLNVPSIPCSDSYFKSSFAVILSVFLYHAYHTHISIIMFHRTAAANKFKQLFPAQFCGHTQAQTVMTSNSFTLSLCATRNKTQGDSTWKRMH